MRIENNGKTISIYTEYNAGFVKAIKKLGGAKWDAYNKCWNVYADEIDKVRELMIEYYGYSDQQENILIDLEVEFIDEFVEGLSRSSDSAIVFFNKTVAYLACSGDLKQGTDISLVTGKIKKGWEGSKRSGNPTIEILKGTKLKIYGVNKNLYEREIKDYPDYYRECRFKIINDNVTTNIDIEALKEEKEKLLARIKEIDELLNSENNKETEV